MGACPKTMCRILAADPDDALEPWVSAIADALAATVITRRHGDDLEAELFGDVGYDLVVTAAQLEGQSGLAVLARARSQRITVPFIVVTSVQGNLARVMVSDAANETLSSRTLDRDNLAMLARGFVRGRGRPVA